MNSIKQITSGLASSLLLAAGLTLLAEKSDPLLHQAGSSLAPVQPSAPCVYPCAFTPEAGQ